MQKVVLITGASRGLGESLARNFWAEKYSLCLVARNTAGLHKVASSLPERTGQQITVLPCDLADPVSVDALAAKVRESCPRLDVLINNAAFHGPIGPLWENDFSLWQQAIQVNLLAPVALCRAFVPWMKETGGGSIINLSGGGATGPRGGVEEPPNDVERRIIHTMSGAFAGHTVTSEGQEGGITAGVVNINPASVAGPPRYQRFPEAPPDLG